ncbi:hypothetical protein T492DRAFT_1026638 [Pavlovales sp. CCMP2436]|nr:hypothetical protein T492DRAFT_1026638 [Pavlovales sp. CCMP2436]
MANKKARQGAAKVSVKTKPKTPDRHPSLPGIQKVGWNKSATLRQNYTKMKLVVDVNAAVMLPDPADIPREQAPIEGIVPEARFKFTPLQMMFMNEIRPLIRKYGDDCGRMARDRKLNQWQRTAPQLERLVKHFHETKAHEAAKVAAENPADDDSADDV